MQETPRWRQPGAVFLVGGAALLAGTWRIRELSGQFVYGSPMADRPILEFVAILVGLGLVYLVVVGLTLRTTPKRWHLAVILLVGAASRAMFFTTNPILEDDYYRYLWDGGVTAAGINPYAFAPKDAAASADADVAELAREAGTVLRRVNHPSLTTVYPPVAQAAFAVAHRMDAWNLDAWRAVLLAVDASVLALLLLLLRATGRPLHWVLVYWWNTLAIVTTMSAGHMDVLVLPFALAAVLFAIKHRAIAAAVAGGLAVCTKIWPLVIAPVLIRNLPVSPGRLAIAAIFGAATLLAVGSPMYAALDQGDASGFAAYTARWEMNDAVFMLLLTTGRTIDASDPQPVARLLLVAITLAVVAAVSIQRAPNGAALVNRLAIALGVFFVLLPAPFPWYYLWVLPFLAGAPRASLLSLTATLPLYYLKFWYDAHGNADFFHTRIVWLEYAPCLVLGAVEFARYLSRSAARA